MADTSKLNFVTQYILDTLGNEFGTEFIPKAVPVGTKGVNKKFSGISRDKSTLIHVCHHSGKTKGGNIPVGKLNGLYAKCYLMEKAQVKNKYIYFTNREFYEIFQNLSQGIVEGIELKYFGNLPSKYEAILLEVLKNASDEM